mgnify:CR=1 FL=1
MSSPDAAPVDPLCEALAHACGQILAGKPPEIQGAVLAELVGIWLSGHKCDDAMRARLLDLHLQTAIKFAAHHDAQFKRRSN